MPLSPSGVPPGERRRRPPRAPDAVAGFPAPLRIESLVAGGSGLARLDGMAVFVPGAAPGDLAELEGVRRTADYAVGRVVRLLEASPLRREPLCPHVPDCGGCQWQHLRYEAQLAAKEAILADALRRIGKLAAARIDPIVPSPDEFHYRHRVQLKVLTGGRMRWGFFSPDSHRLVDIRACRIAHPSINLLLADLEAFLRAQGVHPESLGTVDLAVDGTGRRVDCTLHPRRRRFELPAHGRRVLFRPPAGGELEVLLLNATQVRKLPVTPGDFTFPSDGIELSSGPGVFSQNNLALNPRLVRRVIEFAAAGGEDAVADLYCGVGNYSVPLARQAALVEAVENNRRGCLYGEANARAAGLANLRFIQRNAQAALADLSPPPAIVVVNPPRVGAAEIMEGLVALAPRRIVYVSCNPATLARDLSVLAGAGWRCERLSPFDMFPQTHHLETVALLARG